ncbi:MAG TPA: AMP-binding protein [Thermoanaerobaculia bacterium]
MHTNSVGSLLRDRAQERAEQDVFFCEHEPRGKASLSYGELDLKARAVAAALLESIPAGGRVLLLYPVGFDFIIAFFACALAGVVAVPVPPPEPRRLRRTLVRLRSILADAEPAAILTTSRTLAGADAMFQGLPELRSLRCLATDMIDSSEADAWRAPPAPTEIAYLQYTSGSTSTPKGVVGRHDNLLASSRAIQHAWGYGPDSVAVMWVPNFHDDGLVHGILQPVFSGFPSHLLTPSSVVERPVRWLKAVSRVRATHSGGPNFAYALCANRVSEEERHGLDLSSWRVAYNAAEPVRAGTLDAFCRAFGACGFRREAFFPAYGLAEATLLVTTKSHGGAPGLLTVSGESLEREGRVEPAGEGRTLVSCGSAVPDMTLVIADPGTGRRLAAGQVGEVWLAGPCVARGYWNRAEATREVFGARLAEEEGEGPFLRTGDLGFLHEGELYITSRLKDVILIHGRNHYPQDIELTVEQSRPELRPGCGAALALEVAGEQRLVLVQEVTDRAPFDGPAIIEHACREVFEVHDLQVYAMVLIRPKSIPKTSSGKIQRHACRAELLAGELEEVEGWVLGRAGNGPVAETLRRRMAGCADTALPGSPVAVAEPETDAGRDAAEETALWLRDWSVERLNSRLIDERRSIPPSVILELGDRGLFGLQVDRADGGLGLSHRGVARVLEQLAAIDLTLACLICGHNSLGLFPLQRFASEAMRRELLPDLARGRALAAFAMTEPGAGSNIRGIASRALPRGNGWSLEGRKVWIGSAAWAGVIHVFAQVPGSGLTGFAVRRGTPGLRLGPEALTLGLRGMVQSAIELNGVPVGRDDLLGAVGEGLNVAEDTIALSRLFLGAVAVGGMKRCLQLMTRFADRRRVATGRLLDHPVVRARLGEVAAATSAVEALVGLAARSLDEGRFVPREVLAVLKTAAAESLWQAADHLVQMLGGRGYVETGPAPQILRDARSFRIFEGPTEVLHQFVGSSLLHGGALEAFLAGLAPGSPVAARLTEVAQRLRERAPVGWETGDPVGALRWAHHRAGELATSALLLAALETAPAGGARHALEWARLRFEEQSARALSRGSEEACVLTAAETAEVVAEVAGSIGEMDQRLAGEEVGFDPLLCAALPAAESAVLPAARAPLAETVDSQPVEDSLAAARVREWLARWITRQIGLAPEAIDLRKAFSTLGLDSVTGVQMAADLSAWLGLPVEATAAWDFPNPYALAAHLSGRELLLMQKDEPWLTLTPA